jgi:hypothetical protein
MSMPMTTYAEGLWLLKVEMNLRSLILKARVSLIFAVWREFCQVKGF